MEKYCLKDRVAIITGAGSGIGRAIAILFTSRGAKVVLNGRDVSKLEAVTSECRNGGAKPGQCLVVPGDVTNEEYRQSLIQSAVKHFGKIDILVNNAGSLTPEPLRDITEAGIDMAMDVLFKAPVILSKHALPHLKRTKGCIVNISTAITTENIPGFFSYTAAKEALDKFTECAAKEFKDAGIRVNGVKPGLTETHILDELYGSKLNTFMKEQESCTMVGGNAKPSDVAEMVAFLASDAASHVTAAHFHVDGGRSQYTHMGHVWPVASLDDL